MVHRACSVRARSVPMSVFQDANTFQATVREWIGDGLQPDPAAQDRADVCTGRLSGRRCPFNWAGGWLFPKAVAATVRRWAEAKTKLNLRVEGESQLGHCEICNCRLNLKIHVPLKTILNHAPKEQLEEFLTEAPWCWINTESNINPAIK